MYIMISRCGSCKSGCIDCCKIVKKAPWDKCLDIVDVSKNLCLDTPKLNADTVIAPHPHHQSRRMRNAQIVKPAGNTAYGRWRSAKYNKQTKKYRLLGSRNFLC